MEEQYLINNIYNNRDQLMKIDNINDIVKRLIYNIFVSLNSELTNDDDIQKSYEWCFKNSVNLENEDVIINETNKFNKEILENYEVLLGIKKSPMVLSFLDMSWIVSCIEKILKEKNKIKNKAFLLQILPLEGCTKDKTNGFLYKDVIKGFLKDPSYYIYSLDELFLKGNFCKDIMSLNPQKCMIIPSHYTIAQVCHFILNQCAYQMDHIRNEKNKYQVHTLNSFFGEREDETRESKEECADTIETGYSHNKKELHELVNGKKGLLSLLTMKDISELKQNLFLQLKKINAFKRSKKIEQENMILSLDELFTEKSKEWNRSTINGSQEEPFLNNAIMISAFMRVVNGINFEHHIQVEAIKDKIEELNKIYLWFGLTVIMTVTKSLLYRSQYLKTNLATNTEVTFSYYLLGIFDSKMFLRDKSIPIFCQLMEKNYKEMKNDLEESPFLELLGYRDNDFKIICRLFYHINEEYQQYSRVRYYKSDTPEKPMKEKPPIIYDVLRYAVMLLILLSFHYIIFNQYQDSPFNIFRNR